MEDVQPPREKAYKTLLPLWPRAYLPQFCWSIGYGGMLPVLALAATRVGASTSVAAFIVAVYGFGTVLFDLPAGWIIARIGEYPASKISTVVIAIGLAGCFFSKTPVELAIAVIPVSFGWGIWNLKVLTHLSRVAPVEVRGRALGLIGGFRERAPWSDRCCSSPWRATCRAPRSSSFLSAHPRLHLDLSDARSHRPHCPRRNLRPGQGLDDREVEHPGDLHRWNRNVRDLDAAGFPTGATASVGCPHRAQHIVDRGDLRGLVHPRRHLLFTPRA